MNHRRRACRQCPAGVEDLGRGLCGSRRGGSRRARVCPCCRGCVTHWVSTALCGHGRPSDRAAVRSFCSKPPLPACDLGGFAVGEHSVRKLSGRLVGGSGAASGEPARGAVTAAGQQHPITLRSVASTAGCLHRIRLECRYRRRLDHSRPGSRCCCSRCFRARIRRVRRCRCNPERK